MLNYKQINFYPQIGETQWHFFSKTVYMFQGSTYYWIVWIQYINWCNWFLCSQIKQILYLLLFVAVFMQTAVCMPTTSGHLFSYAQSPNLYLSPLFGNNYRYKKKKIPGKSYPTLLSWYIIGDAKRIIGLWANYFYILMWKTSHRCLNKFPQLGSWKHRVHREQSELGQI